MTMMMMMVVVVVHYGAAAMYMVAVVDKNTVGEPCTCNR
jgi:hypothetical protein